MKKYILLLFLLIDFLSAGEKIALLIGNTQYKFQPLSNPVNDVRAINKTLIEIGFSKKNVKVLENASKEKIEKALYSFSQRAANAEISLIYFSGHGMQVNNTNYMFPANSTAKTPLDLMGLVDLDYFIQSVGSAKYGIVLVDACRNNPLIQYFQNGRHKGSTAKRGLGQVTPTAGQVVIGFATSAGDTADDGGGSMSPYARALSNRLKENDDIRNILGKVAKDVSGKYEQNPIYRANLAYSVCLTGKCKNNLENEVQRLKDENESLKNKNNKTKEQIIDKSTSSIYGVSITGGTVYGNVSAHTGDNIYGTQVETNIDKKDKR